MNLHKIEFEKRKELVELFKGLLKIQVPPPNPLVNYLYDFRTAYIEYAFAKYFLNNSYFFSYTVKDMTFCSGALLRAFLDNPELHKALLNIDYIGKLVTLITNATFDVASDAIDTFTVFWLLLKNREF